MTHSKTTPKLLLLATLGLFPALTHAATKDACTLISAADAQAALGEPVGPPQSENRSSGASDGSSCKFRSTIGKLLSAKSISVTVQYTTNDLTGSINSIADNLKSTGFLNVRQVPGVGTAAVWGANPSTVRPQGELTVIKGKSIMLIILITNMPDEAAALERAKAIALKALPKA